MFLKIIFSKQQNLGPKLFFHSRIFLKNLAEKQYLRSKF